MAESAHPVAMGGTRRVAIGCGCAWGRSRSWTWAWTASSTRGGTALSATWRDDKFHDECGLFGIWNHPEAANVTYLGLYALQHRGQESAGIAATDGSAFHLEKAMGWVADVFSPERLRRLPGHRAIGHVRYSTAGSSNLRNAQPITADLRARPDRHRPQRQPDQRRRAPPARWSATGAIFQSNSDTEVILHLLARAAGRRRWRSRSRGRWPRSRAPTRVLILTRDALYAVRDPYGFRPLTLGGWVTPGSSRRRPARSTSWRPELERDVEPGELVVISDAGLSVLPRRAGRRATAVRVRVRLLRAAGLRAVGPQRPHRAQGAGPSARPRASGRGGHRHPGAGFGHQRRARLLRGVGQPLRARAHPQPLRRAAPSSSPSRGSATSA